MSFLTQIQVRYAETDQMGVAHHGSYIAWLEQARIAYLKKLGIEYKNLEKDGIFLPVAELNCRYRSSLEFDDLCEIHTWISDLTKVSIEMSYRLMSQGREIAIASTKLACTNKDGICRMPAQLFEAFNQEWKGNKDA